MIVLPSPPDGKQCNLISPGLDLHAQAIEVGWTDCVNKTAHRSIGTWSAGSKRYHSVWTSADGDHAVEGHVTAVRSTCFMKRVTMTG